MEAISTTDTLRRRAEIIRDETQDLANTAERVGQLLVDMVDGGSSLEIIELNDLTLPTDENVYSALRTDKQIADGIGALDDRFIRKDVNDSGFGFYTWEAGWMTKSTIRSAEYNIGWDAEAPTGWSVSETGSAWYSSLNVRGPILSNNIIGSPYYASGWTGFGSQWDLDKHRLETDFISVRKELRVYALDVFRIYGTNGDLAVSTTNKIDRVEDMGSVWRCHIDDYDGEMYMNMRIDDVVKCQTWEKLSGRYYMARVTDINNTWFELSKTLLEGDTIPAKGDILIRWDNLTNPDRKGLLYLSASDSYAPYMDVRYGDWNATVGTIKVRNGRLDGINDPAFPELYGAKNNFGLYTCNFYGTGDLILRSTGESVSRTFEVVKDQIKMGLADVRYEMRVSESSILLNPAFLEGINNWEITNVFYPWTINSSFLKVNNNPFMNFISGAILIDDPVNDRVVLQVADTTVKQRNELFTDRTAGKYALRFAYRSVLNFGTLEVGIPGSDLYIKLNLSENKEYQRGEIVGEWDGTSDFIVKVAGGLANITDISFTADALGNAINKIRVEYDTKLTFKADEAVMSAFKKEYDEFNRVVREDYATQSWTATKINTEVGTIVNGKLTNYSTLSQTSTAINAAVRDLNMGQYATTTWTSSQITNSVKGKASESYVDQSAKDLTISFNDKLSPITAVTGAFYSFDGTRMRLNRRIEMGTGSNSNFQCVSGLSPDTNSAAFWAGGSWGDMDNSKIKLNHDGSGWLASKNIMWNVVGDATFRGRIESNSSGDRIIIDSGNRCLKMLSGNIEVYNLDFFRNASYTGPRMTLTAKNSNGTVNTQTDISGDGIDIRNSNGTGFFVADVYQKKIWIDYSSLPQNRDNAYSREIYMEGEYVKVRRG